MSVLVIIRPMSTAHGKVSPSPCSQRDIPVWENIFNYLYNVAKLPLGFVETDPDG